MTKLFIVFSCFVVLLLGFGILRQYLSPSTSPTKIYIPPSPTPTPKNSFDVLLMGYGGEHHEGGYLTDTMMIAHLELTKNKIFLISLSRDLWVHPQNLEKDKNVKLNSVYQTEIFTQKIPYSQLLAKNNSLFEIIQTVSGLSVDRYVSLDFSGFEQIIDSLGGINVTNDRPFEDRQYPLPGKEADTCGKEGKDLEDALTQLKDSQDPETIFPCRYETVSFAQGPVHLDGSSALKFARSRHAENEEGDFYRARRQQLVIDAVKRALLSPLNIPKLPTVFTSLSTYLNTDLKAGDITRILPEITSLKDYKSESIVLTTDNVLSESYSDDHQYILVPKRGENAWGEVKQYIEQSINDTLPTPTHTPTK